MRESAAQPSTLTTMTADAHVGAFLSLHFGVNFSRGDAYSLPRGTAGIPGELSRRVRLWSHLMSIFNSALYPSLLLCV